MQRNAKRKDFEEKFRECDDKFNTIFKLTSTASKIIDQELTILKVNTALVELLGYSAEEIEGTKILEYACEEYKEYWHTLQKELWTNQRPFFKLTVCLYKKNRSVVWVNVTTVLFKDESNTFGFTVLDDVTGYKKLEETEMRLNTALKATKIAVWELNLESQKILRSDGHDQIFGYAEDAPYWNLQSYLPHIWEQDLPKFIDVINSLSEGKFVETQFRITTTDGLIKWIRFEGKTIFRDDGKPQKVLGTIADITKDKLIERHKDDFISIASHELKTPITSLKSSLQLLERMQDELPEQPALMVMRANKSVNKIVLLIDDLLNASKLHQQQMELNLSLFNLYTLVEECCQLSSEKPGVIKIAGEEDLYLNGDAERMERVVINLLANAIKYAPGSEQIFVSVEKRSEMAYVSVTDQGPGIPKDKIPLLFNRYYQAEKHDGHYSGLGLGLYISAEIIKRHGGEIGVESTLGKGSTFWFIIPLETRQSTLQ